MSPPLRVLIAVVTLFALAPTVASAHESRPLHVELVEDTSGGVALRFGQSGARMRELDAVLLTHLHVDHVADLPALLKSANFFERGRPLRR